MSGFWQRANRGAPGDCWLWSGARTGSGYGVVTLLGREVSVHRLAWEIERGSIPPGLSVLHRCDVRHCCNPDHLFLGTQAENMRDMASKGRGVKRPGSRHHLSKLTETQVLAIRARRMNGERAAALAREYGISGGTMSDLLHRRTWGHV